MVDLAETPDWTPWGMPRASERGVETAFHHPLVLVRPRDGEIRAASPDAIRVEDGLEWSPMLWALAGRRGRRSVPKLGPETVFRGPDERLFLFAEAACEQLFEGGLLGPRGLAAWLEAFRRRMDFCEARGIAYRQLVIPESPAICAEAITGAPVLSPERPLEQILRAGGDRLRERLIYPLEALIRERAKAETSHPHDVHLTGFGHFVCYQDLIRRLPGVDPAHVVREEDLRVREVLIAGDIARSAGLPARRVDYHEPPPIKYQSVVKGASYKVNQVDVFQTEDASLPRLTMFRTSNSTHLFPYLFRHFSRIVAVASTSVHYDLIESEKPDVVLCEMPERYFARGDFGPSETDKGVPPQDSNDKFEATTGHKLPLP